MLSIHVQVVADYPPEYIAATSAKASCGEASSDHVDDALEGPDYLGHVNHVDGEEEIDDQGVEDDHGYKGRKPPKMPDNVNYMDLHEKMVRIRDKYDMHVDFLGSAAYCRAPWTSALQVFKAKKKVDVLARRLDEQMTELDLEVAKFSQCVSQNVWYDWYSGVDDMTAYTLEDLSIAFGPCTLETPWFDIWNCRHFVSHLQTTLPATVEHNRPADEKSCHTYAQKLLLLLKAISSTTDFHHTMHFAILLKTTMLRRPTQRWTCIDHLSHQNHLTHCIWTSLRQGRTEPHIQFWDFSRAWRELWADWQTWDLFERIHVCALKHRGLLMLIYQLAVNEARFLCQIALQKKRLPVELSMLILEHTMLASGVPLIRPNLL